MLGPLMGQQAQQASDSPTLWTPGESATLLGAYLGWDSSALTLTGTDVDEHRCSYGVGPSFVPETSPALPSSSTEVSGSPVSFGSKSGLYQPIDGVIRSASAINATSSPFLFAILINLTSINDLGAIWRETNGGGIFGDNNAGPPPRVMRFHDGNGNIVNATIPAGDTLITWACGTGGHVIRINGTEVATGSSASNTFGC